MNIVQQRVQEALDQNPKNLNLGGVLFNVEPTEDDFTPGRSTREILQEMRRAAQENILIDRPSEQD